MISSSSAFFSSLAHHRVVALSCVTGLMWAFSGAVSPVDAAGWDVCARGCPYDQVGPALAVARDGDTIRVGPGVYKGGLTITTSVTLVGSGRDATTIRGGGPVITIGSLGAATEPTVTIRGVTLTGGISRTSPMSIPFYGQAGVLASGGGIEIPPGLNSGLGASVSITDSAVTKNRVAPSATVPGAPCPTGPCPAAIAAGAGIDSWGDLTLVRTSVSHNRAGTASGLSTLASDAQGGAIRHSRGDLTITDSTFENNRASASAPNGRFAEGGAILASDDRESGMVTINHTVFHGNSAVLTAALPDTVNSLGHAGALDITGGVQAGTIRDTEFSYNSATMTNTVGKTYADSGAVHGDLLLTLSGDVFSHNSVVSATLRGSPGNAQGDSGAGEVSGTITGTRFTDNTVTISSVVGNATASGGSAILSGSLTESLVRGNRLTAHSPHGTSFAAGAGIQAGDFDITVKDTVMTGNTGMATGRDGTARGGGISDSPVPNGPPGGPLTLTGSQITGNALHGGHGITVIGGGVYSTYPVALTDSVIAGNSPDQCIGC